MVIFCCLQVLERLFLDGPSTPHEAKALSTETLLDILLILYNECCNSSLRKEKTLTDFIELGRTRARPMLMKIRLLLRLGRCIIYGNIVSPGFTYQCESLHSP